MCWVIAGFDNNLYVILTLVLIYSSIPQLFSWSLGRALAFCAVTILFYMAPWIADGSTGAFEQIDLLGHTFLALAIMVSLYTHHTRLSLLAIAQQNQASLVIQAETERENLDELKDMDRLKTGFYTSIVEGLRGPLTLMLSPLDSMLSGDVGDFRPNQIEYIETVRRNALKVLRLSDDLVDLSHLESGLLRLQSEQTNVIGLLEGIVDHATEAAESKGINIGFSSDVSTLEIAFDVEKLERAVLAVPAAVVVVVVVVVIVVRIVDWHCTNHTKRGIAGPGLILCQEMQKSSPLFVGQ